MPHELIASYLKLPVFLLVASRLGGLIMFQPVLGALSVPANIRVMLVLGLAALVTPFVDLPADAPTALAELVLAMGREMLIGILVGLAVWLCFLGLQMAGQLIAQESGLAMGQIADPASGIQQTVLSSFYVNFCVAVYLIVGGHRAVLRACLDTFDSIPLLGDRSIVAGATELLLDAFALGAAVAIRVAAPAVITLFMVNIALGFLSRTVPTINIATVGFSMKALIGFLIMAISLPTAMDAFTGALENVVGWLGDLTGG